jgi:hypothetical protein
MIDQTKVASMVESLLDVFEDQNIDVPEALGASYMLAGITIAKALHRFKENMNADDYDPAKCEMLLKWGEELAKSVAMEQLAIDNRVEIDGEVLSSTVH